MYGSYGRYLKQWAKVSTGRNNLLYVSTSRRSFVLTPATATYVTSEAPTEDELFQVREVLLPLTFILSADILSAFNDR